MSRANQKLPLLTFLTVLLPLMSATEAKADFYRCEYDGRVWVTNKVPAGQRRNCRLIMKTRVREEPAQEQAAASQAAPPAPRKRLAPHTPRVAGRAVFPEERLWAIVQEAAERYTIPEALILAVIALFAALGPLVVPGDPFAQSLVKSLASPDMGAADLPLSARLASGAPMPT